MLTMIGIITRHKPYFNQRLKSRYILIMKQKVAEIIYGISIGGGLGVGLVGWGYITRDFCYYVKNCLSK